MLSNTASRIAFSWISDHMSRPCRVVPACGYSYQWRSLKARTGGLGSWVVSASATWVITWTSNVGQGGTITAPPANSVANLQVGEWQTIGVYAGSESGG